MIKDKIVIKILGERRLEVDGTDSMNKIIVEYEMEVGTIEEVVEKFQKLLQEVQEHPFRFL